MTKVNNTDIHKLYTEYLFLIENKLAALRSYRGVRMSIDGGKRRPVNTIVELSPDHAHTSSEDLEYHHEPPRLSLTPLAHGKN